jgi:hypothetical protein
LKSFAVLDSGITEMMTEMCGRPVVAFPELTDRRVSASSPIAEDLKEFAKGRPVIGLLGVLKPSKGTMTLAKLALDPANSDLCFAFIGELVTYGYTKEEHAFISSLAAQRPNVFTLSRHIHDGPEFNAYLCAVDVVFAGYVDFANSSGILSKVGAFRKPVIVNDGYLMADRVRKYRLGKVVPQGDLQAAGDAIRELLRQKDDGSPPPDWDGYCDEHSYDRLKEGFATILTSIDSSPAR